MHFESSKYNYVNILFRIWSAAGSVYACYGVVRKANFENWQKHDRVLAKLVGKFTKSQNYLSKFPNLFSKFQDLTSVFDPCKNALSSASNVLPGIKNNSS